MSHETFTVLLYFLFIVSFTPTSAWFVLACSILPNFDVCSFSEFTSASGHPARSFLLFSGSDLCL